MQYQNKKFSDVSDDNFNKLNSLTLYKDTVAFEFKNGWTDLVYNLGKDIEDLCKLTNCELPLIQQIKEKFGTLHKMNRLLFVCSVSLLYLCCFKSKLLEIAI